MQKNLSISNFKRYPWAFLICLGLLFTTESIVRKNIHFIRSLGDRTIIYKKKILNRTNQLTFKGLILGNSRSMPINAKYLSDQISYELGEDFQIYNFALPEHSRRSYYLFLKNYLKKHQKPKIIFFEISPVGLTSEWNYVTLYKDKPHVSHRFCLLYSLKDAFEVYPFRFFYQTILSKLERLSFLVTYRLPIYNLLLESPDTKSPPPTIEELVKNRNGGLNYGTVDPPSLEDIKKSGYFSLKFIPDNDTVYWYKKFFAIAQSHNIKVYIFTAPLINNIHQKREQDGTNQLYRNLIESFQKEFNNIEIVEPLLLGYDRFLFENVQHLNGDGSFLFSQQLGESIMDLKFK